MNVFIASGNLGRDMECRYTPNGKCIGTFPLPVKQGWGENEKTSWVQCKIFGERAEKLAEHMTKGKKVTVSGSFVYEEWTDQQGVRHGRPVIIVNDLDMHGGPAPQQQNQQPAQQPPAQNHQPAPADDGWGDFDDSDIPL